jgi:protein involved in polysaccharide export with SLBB domain
MSNRSAVAKFITVLIALVLLLPCIASATVYTLGVGDVLHITVWGHNELTTTVEVRPDGMITFPLVGDQLAAGRTTQDLAGDIQQELRAYVIEPHVTVLVSQFRTVGVQVLGEVKSPGYYQVRANSRLMDALGLAGGPTKAADLSNVLINRQSLTGGTAEIQRVNVNEYIHSGQLSANPILEHGDVIQVDAVGKALILGEVRQPASYDIGPDMNILDLLADAGGALDSADLEQVVLTRTSASGQTREVVINVQSLLAGRTENAPVIQRNDVVFIPRKEQVIVLGAVRSPGTYPLKKGARLLDLVAAAGGLTDAADSRSIAITRSAQGEQEIFAVDAYNAMMGRVGGDNPVLLGGDIVFIPEGKNLALVLGQVLRPGNYPLTDSTRVLELIAAAGGLTSQAAADRVTLTRTEGDAVTLLELDLTLVQQGRQENFVLQPGDVLFVPEGAPQALVLGQVRSPGSYRLTDATRLLDVIAMAGGTLDRAGQTLTLTRAGETREVDLGALTRLGLGNERVYAGDVIHIPEGQQQVLILGEVRNPGYYRFNLGDRVLDAVGYAGGLLPQAAAQDVTLTRQEDGQAQIHSLDLEELMQNRFLSNNLPLQAGDIIIVPKADRSVLVLGEVRSPGYYTISGREKVLDLLAMAGGITDTAQGEAVTLTRRLADGSEEVFTVNADAIMRGTVGLADADNPIVAGGDVIFVPERQSRVLVFGEVRSPGYYPVDSQTRLLDVIARAGGLTQSADEANVALTRDVDGTATTEQIDMTRAMLTGEGNYLLSGGETVLVPRINRTAVVFGEVSRPGAYPVEPGDRLTDILAKAGGPLETADLSQVSFTTRAAGESGGVSVIDLEPALADANHPANRAVMGGETIHVPESNRRVLALGHVQRPGAYTVDRHTRILDLLALAGGPTDNADLTEATLTRIIPGGEEVSQIDIRAILANQGENLVLQGGDILYLPAARQVLVMGEVNRAGSFTLPPGGRILDLLALAGGLKSNFTEQEIIMTRQEGEHERVWHMYYGQLMAMQGENNLLLSGGDVIYVPEARRQVLVLGQVRSPGVYTIPTGARVLDAIALAGGPTDRAALENVGIYRGGSPDDPTTLTMGKDKLLFEGDVQENPLIQGGDVIYVPETTKPNWANIFSFVGGLKTFKDLIFSF